ncbi:MAG: acyl carrier protein [Eubacterium sp.]|nr:acyl carrier protein [Eubacterium sp.]MBQ9022462.1 acyl carrier protein [Eubacterium sp.]
MEFEKIKEVIADVLDYSTDEITEETTFIDDLGADSLDVVQIVMQLEDIFGIEIPDDAIENIVTVGDAVKQIQAAARE